MGGWPESTIGSVCDVIAGQSPKGAYYNDCGEGLPFYQGKKEFRDKYIDDPTKWTTQITREARAGDILMSVRAPVGPINFATERICIGRGLAAIRAGEEVNRDFLFYALLAMQDQIQGNEGAVFPSINRKQIESLPLSFPPIPEQERIVAILDEAFVAIATATANAERNLANAREVFESHLNALFSQNGNGWDQVRPLSELLSTQPRNGWSPPRKYQTGSGFPVLTLSAVTGFEYDGSKVTLSSAPTQRDAHYWLQPGELLVTRSNTPKLVGHVAIYDGSPKEAICPDLIMKMTINAAVADTRFVYYYLRTAKMRGYITSRATGASSTMKKIGKKVVQGFPVPVPALAEQISVVTSLDSLGAEARQLELVYRHKNQLLTELKQSILHKAFTGELTADFSATDVALSKRET